LLIRAALERKGRGFGVRFNTHPQNVYRQSDCVIAAKFQDSAKGARQLARTPLEDVELRRWIKRTRFPAISHKVWNLCGAWKSDWSRSSAFEGGRPCVVRAWSPDATPSVSASLDLLGASNGISEVHFPSIEALEACAASESGKETLAHAVKISTGGTPIFPLAEEETFAFSQTANA